MYWVRNSIHYLFHSFASNFILFLIQLVYLLSYLCLPRIDEALQIKTHHIVFPNDQLDFFSLNLTFRKTHQLGGKRLSN